MCRRNATFIVLSLFLILFCDTTSSECRERAPCICSLPDGHYYDLTPLTDTEPFVDNKFNWTLRFHPCTNVRMAIDSDTTTCTTGNGVSLCMRNKEKNETLFGTVEDTQMKLSLDGDFPIFEIQHGDMKSIINIVCFKENKTSFILDSVVLHGSKKSLHFMLVSPYGCKLQSERGLSTGSVLVILFFISTGVYLICGIIVLKTLRGATGWEMVPNHDFWCKLPSLVKDGIVFTFNCCRADSYERI